MKVFLSLFLIILFSSCAPTKDEELELVVDEANFYLSSMKCSAAKKVLDSISYNSSSADYVSLYSAVYACRAGYTVLGTVFGNLTSIDASTAGLFKSFAAFDSSNEITADSANYVNLKTAMTEIIRNSESTTDRFTKYGSIKGTDLSMQLLFLTLTQFGKFMGYYGNKGADGTKGAGAGANGCMMNYDTAAVIPNLAANGSDSCSGTADGSADLDPADPDFVQRSCEAIVYFNIFGDVVTNVDFSNSDQVGDIGDTNTIFSSIITAATLVEPDVANYVDFLNFDDCETYAATDTDELQRVFAAYVENFYQ